MNLEVLRPSPGGTMIEPKHREDDRGLEDLLTDPATRDLREDGAERDLLDDPGIQDILRDPGVRETVRFGPFTNEQRLSEVRFGVSSARAGRFRVSTPPE